MIRDTLPPWNKYWVSREKPVFPVRTYSPGDLFNPWGQADYFNFRYGISNAPFVLPPFCNFTVMDMTKAIE
jgi:hypothetical protein